MLRALMCCGVVAVVTAAHSPTVSNPAFPGWYADPEVHVFAGEYWIYPTYSARYNDQVFLDAFSSRDLVTWTKHPHIVDTAAVKWARRAMWAPSIVEKDGWYYLFFGANDIQSDSQPGGIAVTRSRSPGGPFVDYLGHPLIDAYHNGAQPIDQMVFQDPASGAWYIAYGGHGHCNIARLNDDFTGFVPFADGTTFKEITPAGYVEGAYMLVKDGKYYFMWSEGGWTGPNYAVAYAIGSSPTGPFERIGKILQQDSTVATGAGHHSVLRSPSGHWYIVYHRRPLGDTDRNHRVVAIDELKFDDRGFILPVKITREGVAPDSLPDAFVRPWGWPAMPVGFAAAAADSTDTMPWAGLAGQPVYRRIFLAAIRQGTPGDSVRKLLATTNTDLLGGFNYSVVVALRSREALRDSAAVMGKLAQLRAAPGVIAAEPMAPGWPNRVASHQYVALDCRAVAAEVTGGAPVAGFLVNRLAGCHEQVAEVLPARWRAAPTDIMELNALIDLTGHVRDRRLFDAVMPIVEASDRPLTVRAAAFATMAIYSDMILTGYVKDATGSDVVSIGSRTHPVQYDGSQRVGSAEDAAIQSMLQRVAADTKLAFHQWATFVLTMNRNYCKYENMRSFVRSCPQ